MASCASLVDEGIMRELAGNDKRLTAQVCGIDERAVELGSTESQSLP
jgi:hypothetical protein